MSDNYTTRTASLKAITGTVSDLDVKRLTANKINANQILINGQDISELGGGIESAQHINDIRQTITDNDLWGQYTEIVDGKLIIHDDEVTNPNSGSAWNTSITKVENNKAYVGNDLFANIQTEKIKDGNGLFSDTLIKQFYGDMPELVNGYNMFGWAQKLTTFNGDMPALRNGQYMFNYCENLSSFTSDLYMLSNAHEMFSYCGKLEEFEAHLGSLQYGDRMFYCCSSLTSFVRNISYSTDLSQFSNDLSNLVYGETMFSNCSALTQFNSNLSSLEKGTDMFNYCTSLINFQNDLQSLKSAYSMFNYCEKLSSFSSDLSSLQDGQSMFQFCSKLSSFDSNLSSLIDGNGMFNSCSSLLDFTYDMSNLLTANRMFYACASLTSFVGDLSSLIDCNSMFCYCNKLTTFTSDLSSLIDGNGMFYNCRLNPKTVKNILYTINDIKAEKELYTSGKKQYISNPKTDGNGFKSNGQYTYQIKTKYISYIKTISASNVSKITIGIDVTNNASTVQQQLLDFANQVGYDTWADLKQAFINKGWTVTWQYGGTSTSITYDLRDGERIIPCPVYTRLIEIIPQGEEYSKEEKKSAEYCNEDGSKFYNIEWGHDVTHPEEFQQFDSIQDAAVAFGVFRKEFLN